MGLSISDARKLKNGLVREFMSVAGFEGFGIGGANDGQGFAIEVYTSDNLAVETKEALRTEGSRILGRDIPRDTFSYVMSAPSTNW